MSVGVRGVICSFVLAAAGAFGCSGDDGSSSTATQTSNSEPTDPGTETGTVTASTGIETETGTEGETESTTADPIQYCNLGGTGDSGGAADPWLEVWHLGEQVADGMTLRLICGGQGDLMFELKPYVGGYDPGKEWLTLGAEVNIEGFNVVNDHFFYQENNSFLVGCKEPTNTYDGGGFSTDTILPVFPPDQFLSEPWLLQDATGDLRVWHEVDGEVIEVTATFTVDAPEMPEPPDEFYCYF